MILKINIKDNKNKIIGECELKYEDLGIFNINNLKNISKIDFNIDEDNEKLINIININIK